MQTIGALRVRTHGATGAPVIVLHGGPAAVGGAAGLARGLADRFRVLEPWQRGSGASPLTVATHVADLRVLIETAWPGERPALIGESWGAMLALAFAAAHPRAAAAIVLVGCGTFDLATRAQLQATLADRANDPYPYDYSIDRERRAEEPFDERAHTETWNDMLRLQAEGVYPAAFAAIRAPVLMLHGSYDPHPGGMIRDGLRPVLPQLEYAEFERCGHSPWKERLARDDFFDALRAWLSTVMRGA
ncbi:MAG TPA: alpha/beta hydrolase [Caulobacteraceae bacterium]|nr:alpha/beta hydrolase [Caulobacteraceae bacterium]